MRDVEQVDLPSPELLLELLEASMPFGKHKGRKLLDLPEPYLVWFHGEGFPNGKLGEQLEIMYEIKRNGLESMLRKIDVAAARAELDLNKRS